MSRLHLFCIVASGILGLAVGQDFVVPVWSLAATASLAIACSANSRSHIIALMVLCFVFGIWRMMSVKSVREYDISRFAGSEVTLSGAIVQPSTVDGTAQRIVMTELVIRDQPQVGAILVSLPAIPVVPTAAHIALTCTVNALTSSSVQRQWSHGIHARCATLRFRFVDYSVQSWRALLGRWQERVLMYVRRNYNEPQASLLNGILIGNTDGMPDRLNLAFQATGTTHIVALSGFNVTIIMAIVVGWMVRIVGRRLAWIPALILLITFVVMSGASASVVRAAVMAVIVHTGIFFGRPISMVRLLLYTVLLMAMANPLMTFHDLGFQLSFLATLGLVLLADPLQRALHIIPERLGLRENLATTLAAMLMTEPLLLWRFGRLSLVAPLVNTVVVPMIPLAMGIGAISLVGMWLPWLSPVLVPTSDALLRLIIWCLTTGATLPHALVQLSAIVTTGCAVGCVVITILLLVRYEKNPTTSDR